PPEDRFMVSRLLTSLKNPNTLLVTFLTALATVGCKGQSSATDAIKNCNPSTYETETCQAARGDLISSHKSRGLKILSVESGPTPGHENERRTWVRAVSNNFFHNFYFTEGTDSM